MASRTSRTKTDAATRDAGDTTPGFNAGAARLVVMLGLAVVLGTAAVMLVISDRPATAVVEETVEAATAATPEPWAYDAATNQHWHPGHGHWHDGPPPSPASRAGDGVDGPPDIPNPQPWQYDAASNRHYDPGHGHWHTGPPPAGTGPGVLTSPVGTDRVDPPPGVTAPEPWQYDAASDRHYHPGHAHWHTGPPPDPANR